MQDQAYQISVYVSDCILNERHNIIVLMSNYSDDCLAPTDRTGNNGIALAAAEGHVELLQWLHEQGCDIHSRNCRGRMPLMIASLRGRVPIADCLLVKVADAMMRDKKGRSALDLALPDPRNRNERRRKMFLYREPQVNHRCIIDRGLTKFGRQETLCREMDEVLSPIEVGHRNLLQYTTRNQFLIYHLG